MRIAAFVCDQCEKLTRGEHLPEDWCELTLATRVHGKNRVAKATLCSASCATTWVSGRLAALPPYDTEWRG